MRNHLPPDEAALFSFPLAMWHSSARREQVISELEATNVHRLAYRGEISQPTSLKHLPELQEYFVWYINMKLRQAVRKAEKDQTTKQHTVPNLVNKSFGNAERMKLNIQGQDRTLNIGTCVRIQLQPQAFDVWGDPQLFPTAHISVVQNIYDVQLPDSEFPEKLVECLLAVIENDVAPILQRLHEKPHRPQLTWHERIVMSCFVVLQRTRTARMQQALTSLQEEVTEMVQKMAPDISAATVASGIDRQLGLTFRHFGMSLFDTLTPEMLNFIFAREWSFLRATTGLVASLNPVVAFDGQASNMFNRGLLHPDYLLFALSRDLLWIMERPNGPQVFTTGNELTAEEVQFANQLISLDTDTLYVHPKDWEIQTECLYRNSNLDRYIYSLPIQLSPEELELESLYLFQDVPERWGHAADATV